MMASVWHSQRVGLCPRLRESSAADDAYVPALSPWGEVTGNLPIILHESAVLNTARSGISLG